MDTQYTILYIGQKHDGNMTDFYRGQRYPNYTQAEKFLNEIGTPISKGYYKINQSKLYIIDENDTLKWCRAFIGEV